MLASVSLAALVASSLSIVAPAPVATAAPTTFTVTTTSDNAAPGDGGDCAIAGSCSLRGAILAANANAGFADTIEFAIPGAAPHDVVVSTALPAVTDTVTIDGFSQPGSSPTNSEVVTINSVPGVRRAPP